MRSAKAEKVGKLRPMQSSSPGVNQENGCPQGCCTGDELLCISIPCPVTVVLLGSLRLTLDLDCVRLTSDTALTGNQANQVLGVLQQLLGSLVNVAPTTNP